jgi:hypothetical protein
MTDDELKAIIRGIVPPLKKHIAELSARLTQVENRPLLKWCGPFREGQPYAEAQLVTKSGDLWVSTRATSSIPGTSGSDWRLVVRRGRI